MLLLKMLFAVLLGVFAFAQADPKAILPDKSGELSQMKSILEALSSDLQNPSLQIPEFEIYRKIRAYEELLPLYPVHDSRLTPRLRGAINTLFHVYHELLAECTSKADTKSLPAQSQDPFEASKLFGIIERKLIEIVATGPCKEGVRILSSRLLEVLEMKQKYEKNEHCSKMDEEEVDAKVQSYLAEVEAKLEKTWGRLGYGGLR